MAGICEYTLSAPEMAKQEIEYRIFNCAEGVLQTPVIKSGAGSSTLL